ncbi:uncharacterized protein CMC5_046750 [Chondromyces crocatus]|uniref:Uncharacterized protein n=1 Tax=Chondromyces crocatus TaxID=52 RepID=A0A0K1EI34_CHOCO|nr:uncharacterized protein CMC5_046750 [Chondromyces crocatus]
MNQRLRIALVLLGLLAIPAAAYAYGELTLPDEPASSCHG